MRARQQGRGAAIAREAVVLAGLGLFIVALTLSPIIDYDVFLHLKTGQLVVESHAVPQVDDYSALARGRPFVAHEWLSGVLFWTVKHAAGAHGFQALVGLAVVMSLLIAAALYAAARLLGASPLLAVPLLALVMALSAVRLVVRPQLFSYLLLATYLLLLAARRAGRPAPPLWLFLPLQIAWANLHGGFLMGPMIVGLAAAGAAIEAGFGAAVDHGDDGTGRTLLREALRLALLAPALVAVSLVNPYGARLLRFPFELLGSSFMGRILEWQPPFRSLFAHTYLVWYYIAWIAIGTSVIVGVAADARRRRTAPPAWGFHLLLFLVLFGLSLRMNRAVTDFALGTFPSLACGLTWLVADGSGRLDRSGGRGQASWLERRAVRTPLVAGTTAALLGLAGALVLHGFPWRPGAARPFGFGVVGNNPVRAADYLGANGVEGNVFNSYETGPYLIDRLYPAVRVAMDSRNDVYGEELYAEYTHALEDPASLAAMLQRIGAVAVVLEWTGGEGGIGPDRQVTARALRQVGPWVPVYFDDAVVIYVRADGERRDLAARDRYVLLDPVEYQTGGLRREDAAPALDEADRAVRVGRGPLIARVMRMEALLALGRRDEALAEEARLLAARPAVAAIWADLGDLRRMAGDRDAAAEFYGRALALAPGWPRALEGLGSGGTTR